MLHRLTAPIDYLTAADFEAFGPWADVLWMLLDRWEGFEVAAATAVDKLCETPESCSSRAPTDAPARLESPLYPSERPLPLPVVPGLQCSLHGRLESRQGKGRA